MNGLLPFVTGPLPGTALPSTFDIGLVALSYIVATLAAYMAVDLSSRVREFRTEPRKAAAWLAGGAIAMGAGIWSMHFIGMLAYQLPVSVRYELWTTLASMAIAIITSGFALFIATRHAPNAMRLALGGAVMGTGIATMHYTGMAAMRLDALVLYYAAPFALSIANAIVCSTAALWLVSRHGESNTRRKALAAAVMGAAIAAMHYTGMYATVCVATGKNAPVIAGLNPMLLAVAITAITLLIMGVALAMSLQNKLLTRAVREQNRLLLSEVAQRRGVESELQEHRDNLQALVDARTRDLSRANHDLLESEARFRATFDQAAVGIAHFDLQNTNIKVNRRYCEIVDYTATELLGKPPGMLSRVEEDIHQLSEQRRQLLSGAIEHFADDRRFRRKDGTPIWVTRTESLARDSTGTPLYFIRVIEDITQRKHNEALLNLQKASLEQIASGAPLKESLTMLARTIELHANDMLCSILLLDKDGIHLNHGAAPSLPDAYCKAIDGVAIGPAVGSCGTAVYRKAPVFVEDIALDPLWENFRDLALRHNLRACWSTPILDAQREMLGTFAIYSRQPGLPTQLHLQLIQLATDLATLAIVKQRTDDTLNMMQLSVDRAGDSVFWTSRDGRLLYVNDAACASLGYTRDELLNLAIADLNLDFNTGGWDAHFDSLKSRGTLTFETRHRTKDGHALPIEVNANYVHINGQEFEFSFSRDITRRKQSERIQAQLASIVETSEDAIVSRAPDDTIVSWNAAAERMFGWTSAEALGQPFRRLLSRSSEVGQGRLEKIIRGEPAPAPREDIRRRKDGSSIHVHTTMSAVRDELGKVLFVSCIMRDVTARLESERHIEHLATKDALTGLSNRSMLMEQMDAAIVRAARNKTELVVMFVDLDRFKEVNDTLGHAIGDDLLRECARRLTECVREADIVARLGGDEFVVLLTNVTDVGIVSPIADRMIKLLTLPYHLQDHDTQTSASLGICFYPADGRDVATLLKNADIAMYHAKELGRNNYQFYAEEMNQRRMQRLQLERELRAAVENNEFVLHYQPQVAIATGEIQGAESLIRWQHPTRGLLPPADFIAVAEETGLIVPMGVWVLNHACRTIKMWRANGAIVPYVVVNVSAAQLSDQLVKSVREALIEHGIEAGWLMLEITETMLMERVEEAITILRRIRELGIRIAMDDFGTGYSSLSVLQRLPLDTLKIDRSFVSAIDDEANNARACAIIGAIIAIASELNLSVVAEGVETATQLAFLRTLNCDAYQGYLYSVPVDTIAMAAQFITPLDAATGDTNEHGRAVTKNNKITLELPFGED